MNNVSLLSEPALQDLYSSGLSVKTIQEMNILSLNAKEITQFPKFSKPSEDGYYLPYHQTSTPYARRKNIPPIQHNGGDPQKYSAPYNVGTHLYILSHDWSMLTSPKCTLVLSEGEKTTGKLSQEFRKLETPSHKFAVIGVSGLWQFLSSPEISQISWKDKEIIFAFDADVPQNTQSIKAVFRILGYLVTQNVSLDNLKMLSWDVTQGKGGDDYFVTQEKQGISPQEILHTLLDSVIPPFQLFQGTITIESACTELIKGADGCLTRSHIDFLSHHLKSLAKGATIPLVRRELRTQLSRQLPEVADDNAIYLGTQQKVKEKLYQDPLPVIAQNAWDIVISQDNCTRFFRRDTAPVFIDKGLPYEISLSHLQSICNDKIKWIVKIGDTAVELARRTVPFDIPSHMLHSAALRSLPLPKLERIVHAPYFGRNYSLHKDPGYSREYATLYYQNGTPFITPAIPRTPTPEDIHRAKSWIFEVLRDFPFVDLPSCQEESNPALWENPDRTHAIALMIEPFIRSWFTKSPLYLIESPTEGTGKGLLADACLFPSLGKEPIKTTAPVREEEWEKRITALLSTLPSVVYFDNVSSLQSQYLNKALTSSEDHGRKLQTSEMVTYPNQATWIATGINPKLNREMIRRSLRIRITAFCENPSARTGYHHTPLLQWVASHRKDLVWSLLTLIQSYIAQGMPAPKQQMIVGSFEDWARHIQGILECNGIFGFYQNQEALRVANDGGTDNIKPFIYAWLQAIEILSDEDGTRTIPMKSKTLYDTLIQGNDDPPIDTGIETSVRQIGTLLGLNVDRTFEIEEERWILKKKTLRGNVSAWSLELLPEYGIS